MPAARYHSHRPTRPLEPARTVLDTAIDAVFAWEALGSRANPIVAAEVTLLGGARRLPGLPHISPAGQIIPSARER